ncbi:hypothetical protein AOQ84DRAFT_386130 [Glonium stellatum]|uniref:Mso1 N-terminal domain-containing protein n=1 Tax=Glonium stellatum TaxID=574774 RepID=A0A8E2JX59_9PEZI|nr:hypothetical protein AOQ84DRAFT_386130 [Glonium stellatum]
MRPIWESKFSMSSYISNLLTTTTSRYNSLRRTLLSDEADGDTEDDSHISRVLRAYYTEKGRPFPPWLPPDPKAPQLAPTQFVSSAGRQPGQPATGRGGGLSDLWDSPQQQQQQQEPTSLRRTAQGRGGGRGQQGRPGIVDSYPTAESARPLPSQRAGSYQSAVSQQSFTRPPTEPSPPPSSGSGGTAQERLKARLWGSGRSNSPTPRVATSTANTSPAQTPGIGQAGLRNPYERSNVNTQSSRPSAPYPDDRSGYSMGGGQGTREQSPYMSANSPWSTSGDEFSGAYDSGGRSYGGPRTGGRERIGLPNGPRPR